MKGAFTAIMVFSLLLLSWRASAEVISGPADETGIKPTVGSPSQLRLFIVDNGFQLSWKLSPQDPGKVTGYEIVRSAEFNGPYERLAVVNRGVRQYLDTSAAPNLIYFYKVRAITGDEYSHFSNIAGGERPFNMP